jgi:LysM repeat protein
MSQNEGSDFFEYTIQPEDTLWDLAADLDITVDDILAVNVNLDPDNLYVGQIIYLPNDSQVDVSQRPERRRPVRRPPFRRPFGCRRSYVVRPGDTLYRIAFRFGIPVRTIIAVNPYINFGYPLQVGQFICIP